MSIKTASDSCWLRSVFLMTTIFVSLKLYGELNWSWLWILSPVWITLSIVSVAFGIVLVFGILSEQKAKDIMADRREKEKSRSFYDF